MGGQSFGLDSNNMDSNASPENPMEIDDSTEWEYEYDENQTEDFYFTVDIAKPEPVEPEKKQKPKPQGQQGIPKEHTNGVGSTARNKAPSALQSVTKPTPAGTSQVNTVPNGNIEFVDLHTANPLLKLDDQQYSCHWATDLGTQVHVARSGTIRKSLRPGRVLDVVGMTRTRLVAKPAEGRLRKDHTAEIVGVSAANDGSDGGNLVAQASNDVSMNQPKQSSETREMAADPSSEAIKSFREQLKAIRMRKRVGDSVPAGGISGQDPP